MFQTSERGGGRKKKEQPLFQCGKDQHGACAVFPLNHRLGAHHRVSLSGCPQHLHRPHRPAVWNSKTFTGTWYKGFSPCTRGTLLKTPVFKGKLNCRAARRNKPAPSPAPALSFGLTWGLWTGELNLRSTTFMKWLQIRKWIAICQGEEGRRKEMKMTPVQHREKGRKKHSHIKTSLGNNC